MSTKRSYKAEFLRWKAEVEKKHGKMIYDRLSEVIDTDGYFHTGDLAKRDSVTGEYTITGRIKNMIVIGNGKKIFPEEIEYLLEKCPAVSDK